MTIILTGNEHYNRPLKKAIALEKKDLKKRTVAVSDVVVKASIS